MQMHDACQVAFFVVVVVVAGVGVEVVVVTVVMGLRAVVALVPQLPNNWPSQRTLPPRTSQKSASFRKLVNILAFVFVAVASKYL